MSWVDKVECACGSPEFTVVGGVWTCRCCSRIMTIEAIKGMQNASVPRT